MTTEATQTIVTQKGDRLLDLCKRVYGIREPDRALMVATAVSAIAKNRAAVQNKIGVPLAAGLQIEFPAWAEVTAMMKSQDQRKAAVQSSTTAPQKTLNPMAPMRQVAIGKQASQPVGERSLPREMARTLGLHAQAAVEEFRPLGSEDADPTRTQSAGATRIVGFGRKLAKEAARTVLSELLHLSEKAFEQNIEMMLNKLNPRAFMPNVDTGPTIAVLLGGFFPALAERLGGEAKLELERRRKLLERGFLRVKIADLALPADVPASRAFGADGAAAFAAAQQAVTTTTTIDNVAPRVVAQIKQQYGVTGSAHEQKVFMPRIPASLPPLVQFLDAFAPGGDDGPLAQKLFEVVTRVSDTHRAAVAHAASLTAALQVDEKEAPNASLVKHLSSLLKTMREVRVGKTPEEQTRLLADERHLLSGRNFVSFRKDIAVALDKRLTFAAHLTPLQRMTVLLALLMQDGHRLPTMRVEEMDAACERLMQAL